MQRCLGEWLRLARPLRASRERHDFSSSTRKVRHGHRHKKFSPTQWNKAKSVTLQTTAQHEPGRNCDRLNNKPVAATQIKCSKQHVEKNKWSEQSREMSWNHCVRHHTLSCGRPNIQATTFATTDYHMRCTTQPKRNDV